MRESPHLRVIKQCVMPSIHLPTKLSKQMWLQCPWLHKINCSHNCVQNKVKVWFHAFGCEHLLMQRTVCSHNLWVDGLIGAVTLLFWLSSLQHQMYKRTHMIPSSTPLQSWKHPGVWIFSHSLSSQAALCRRDQWTKTISGATLAMSLDLSHWKENCSQESNLSSSYV